MKREKMRRAASSSGPLRGFHDGDEEDGGIKERDLSDNEINSEFLRMRNFRDGDEEDGGIERRAHSDTDSIRKKPRRIILHKRQPRTPRKYSLSQPDEGNSSSLKYGCRRPEWRSKPGRLRRQQTIAPAVTFGYELYEGNSDQLPTTVLPNSYIDPESLEFNTRIGHGLFGDVWLARHHQSGKRHEVAVKMLHSMNKVHVREFLHKFEEVWRNLKSKQLNGICCLHGISIISGQICIVFKWYKGSVGGQIACTNGGKLPIQLVLRYGSELANGIQLLHQLGHLVLNLKPSNFLLDEHDHIVLGDFGIPYLLRGFFWKDPCLAMRFGTPNYMAPEQWEPRVRGPMSYETDSWGFACSMIEMLTGVPPWFRRSAEEIHHAVVIRQEKPQVPTGLHPAVERMLEGCFEYDFRNRPLIPDIIHLLERVRKTVYSGGSWSEQVSNGLTKWFLLKDHIVMGDTVRSRKDPNKPQSELINDGVVVGQRGLDMCVKRDKLVVIQCPFVPTQSRLKVSTLLRVTSGFASGDWVQLVEANGKHSSLGIVHHIYRDETAAVGFLGLETLWRGRLSELKLVEPFLVGQLVRLKANMSDPQFEWPYKRGASCCSGKISKIHPNGCLEVTFPCRFVLGDERCSCFLANPDDVERVSFEMCRGIVEKYEFVEDLHWAVKPIAFVFGLFAVAKVGAFVVGNRLSGIGVWTKNMLVTKRDETKAIHKG